MAKEKKQNYSNQNSKGTRNIHKDNMGNSKNKEQFGSKGNNQKDNSRKNNSYNLYHSQMLPPNKPRSNHPVQHTSNTLSSMNPAGSGTSNPASHKKVQLARSQQVQQTLSHLQVLETLLDNYQNFQVDETQNLKSIVQSILQKQIKQQK